MNVMTKLALALAAAFALVSTVPASEPFSMAPIGTLKTGLLRADDPRIAEINAYDASGRRIYVVTDSFGSVSDAQGRRTEALAEPGALLEFTYEASARKER